MKFHDKQWHHNYDHKSIPTDEYYTKYEEVKEIFEEILIKEDLKDKIIYCPADEEKSNFVKYLKEHKDDIQYKELIYTWDDMMTHEDLFIKADYIITNPPFSMLKYQILPLLKKNNCKFFLLGSLTNNHRYIKTFNPNECKYIRRRNHPFITPFVGEISKSNETFVASTIYITNMNIKTTFKECTPPKKFLTKTINEIPNVFSLKEGYNYLVIDRIENYPKDYYEPVWVTLSALQYKYTKYFDYIDDRYKNGDILCDGNPYTDSKGRFMRVLVKLKDVK